MNFKGRIEFISGIETINGKDGKTYEKQYVVVSDEQGKYPNRIIVESLNKSDEVAKVKTGQIVTVNYNASVREWNGKHFGQNSLYKFEDIEQTGIQSTPVSVEMPEPVVSETDGTNEMPF
jgi:hypothetical protein